MSFYNLKKYALRFIATKSLAEQPQGKMFML